MSRAFKHVKSDIKQAKDYQLDSMLEQAERFRLESVTNTMANIMKYVKSEVIKEQKLRAKEKENNNIIS